MTDTNLTVSVGPIVQVVLTEGDRTIAFSDFAQAGDDPATMSDAQLIARVENWLDIPGRLSGFMVSRPGNGNILVSPKPTFGMKDFGEFDDEFNKAKKLARIFIIASAIVGVAGLLFFGFVLVRILIHFGVF